jgi:Domain of unknown function DUF29
MSGEVGLYEQDFVRWTEAQAAGLRRAAETKSNLPLDWMNLAEEVESLGRSQRRELRSRLANIIEHLLQLQHSPATEPRIGWTETIGRERREIERLLEDSPSLRGELEQALAAEWHRTAKFVAEVLEKRGELQSYSPIPLEPPGYSIEQLLGAWLPDRAPLK